MSQVMVKEQLIQEFAAAYEQAIATAAEAARRGVTRQGDGWGPREIIAHLAGWEVIASVRIPKIVAGMPPLEFADEAQQTTMDDAINAAIVTMIGDQSLEAVCGLLRQAYQRVVAILKELDDTNFQPGAYVYERTKDVVKHCQEHREQLAPSPGE